MFLVVLLFGLIVAVSCPKCGCFKRKTIQDHQSKMDGLSIQSKSSSKSSLNKPKQDEKENMPLNAEKGKGCLL